MDNHLHVLLRLDPDIARCGCDDKLRKGWFFGRFFAGSREELREAAGRLHVGRIEVAESLLYQQAWSGNGGDADLLELADESPERVGIALGGKPHDGGPLENSAHGFHSLKFTVAPRLHDEPEVVVTEDCPRLSSDALPESHPWLTPANFQATIRADRDGTLRIYDGQSGREFAMIKPDAVEQPFGNRIGPQ